jgi:Flp pilus assembly protein TadG
VTASLAGDRGSVTAFVAVVAVALVMVAGMAYDGGQVIAAHGRARSDASQAARAGAQEIDITALRASGESVLDPESAADSARAYLADAGATGTVSVDGSRITVTVTTVQPMHILPVPDRTVTASVTVSALEEATP